MGVIQILCMVNYLIVCVLKQYADHTNNPNTTGTITPVPPIIAKCRATAPDK